MSRPTPAQSSPSTEKGPSIGLARLEMSSAPAITEPAVTRPSTSRSTAWSASWTHGWSSSATRTSVPTLVEPPGCRPGPPCAEVKE